MGNKRVVVTGGTGFVGANLARYLLKEGYEVCLLVRPGYNKWRIESIRKDVELREADLADRAAVNGAVSDIKPDWVFHLAAYGAYPWQTDQDMMIRTNLTGVVHLMNASVASGAEVFINTGSSSEYGFKDHAPMENESLDPNSEYAVTKASATQFCRHAAREFGIRTVTLRLYSVYGPYEEAARLVPALIIRGLEKRLPPLVNPVVARDFVYIDDVCRAYIMAAMQPVKEPGAVFNVGTGIQTSIKEAVDVARRLMNIKEEPHWGSMNDRSWDTNVWVADNRKISTEIGWKPDLTFEQGFRKTLDWFRDNPDMLAAYQKMAEDHLP